MVQSDQDIVTQQPKTLSGDQILVQLLNQQRNPTILMDGVLTGVTSVMHQVRFIPMILNTISDWLTYSVKIYNVFSPHQARKR